MIYDALHRVLTVGDLVVLPGLISPVVTVADIAPNLDGRGGVTLTLTLVTKRIVPDQARIKDVLQVQAAPTPAPADPPLSLVVTDAPPPIPATPPPDATDSGPA